MLDAALLYEQMGWSVVPVHRSVKLDDGSISCTCRRGTQCDSPGKHPALFAWSQYQQRRPTPDELRNWFGGEFKGYGVGIITGRVSGIFAVDVDAGPGKLGGESFDALQIMYGDIPHTIEARTGGGGRHIILRHPGTCDITTDKNIPAPGIDIRGDGGFIVTAPSLHPSGRSYLWNEHHHPQTTEIAEAPSWLVDLVKLDAPRADGARAKPTGTGEIVRDAWGKIIDGRERYMIGVVGGVVAGYLRANNTLPTPEWVMNEAWPVFERSVRVRGQSLEADRRGPTLMREKIRSTLRRISVGKWKLQSGPLDDPEHEPEHPNVPGGSAERTRSSRPPILSIFEIENLPPPLWLVEGLVPERALVMPYGPPKKGKTFVVLSLSLHIAAGLDWMGKAVVQGGVVYIAGEGVGGLGLRIKAMRFHYGISENIPFWVVPKAVNFSDPAAVDKLVALVRDTVLDEPIALVVVDTLARAAPGVEENSSKEMGAVIASCDAVRDALDCAVMPIHHQGKDGAKGLRGSSAIHGAVDASFQVTGDLTGTAKRVTLTPVDQKDADPGPAMTFDMIEVATGIGRSSLVPVVMGATEDTLEPQKRTLTGQEALAMRALESALADHGENIRNMPDVPGHVPACTDEKWREAFRKLKPDTDWASARVTFRRVASKLIEHRIVGCSAPYVWKARHD